METTTICPECGQPLHQGRIHPKRGSCEVWREPERFFTSGAFPSSPFTTLENLVEEGRRYVKWKKQVAQAPSRSVERRLAAQKPSDQDEEC